ncbi:MAG: pteridine reductase [Ferrimonas sp.]
MKTEPKVVLITGSARRIGAALIHAFHHQGCRVIVHCHRSADEGKRLVAQLNAIRTQSAALLLQDLIAHGGPEELALNALDVWGKVDLLINNASAFYPRKIGQITETDWIDIVGTNMKAPLLLSQALASSLIQHQGCIINMADIHGQAPLPQHTLYCMAKAALIMMTQSLALELAPQVRVNAIAPGAIAWPEPMPSLTKQQAILAQIPLARLGGTQAIVDAALFLAFGNNYMTGQTIAVDGGRSITT